MLGAPLSVLRGVELLQPVDGEVAGFVLDEAELHRARILSHGPHLAEIEAVQISGPADTGREPTDADTSEKVAPVQR